jgi:hypothetical protein
MDGLDTTPAPPTFMEPQFIFGLILVFSWLIFMAVALSLYHTDMNTAITAMERISALFGAALGFVWGFYFGTKNSQQLIKQLMTRISDLEKLSK